MKQPNDERHTSRLLFTLLLIARVPLRLALAILFFFALL